jgi:16S rRNA (guanine966-N2)-methyltransferase
MRVIGGIAKRTTLDSLDIEGLRPMLDRVRESLFNILQGEIQDARVLDLFSGTGAIGIEALSRGAASAVFVEKNKQLCGVIKSNLEKCGLEALATVLTMDVMDMPARTPPNASTPAELVFIDPPYAMIEAPNERQDLFSTVEACLGGWFDADSLLVLHHLPRPHMLWPTRRLICFDRRVYGRSQLSFFQPVKEDQTE